jgi:LemA protein
MAQAENVLTGALRQLFALSEAYPDLKANQNFLSLQEELTSTEDRIAYSRQFYNDSVLKYDNKIESIPSNIIAGMFGFVAAALLEITDPGRREAPKVQF